MTFTNIQNNQAQAVNKFQQFSPDDQLALLWYFYEEIGESVTPKGGPDTAGFNIAESLYHQIQQMSPEQQLQVQREIVSRQESQISQTYGNLNSSTKLALWYLLAQGIEENSIIDVPSDYSASQPAQSFLNEFKQLDFNDQVTFLRSAVLAMGFGSPQETQV